MRATESLRKSRDIGPRLGHDWATIVPVFDPILGVQLLAPATQLDGLEPSLSPSWSIQSPAAKGHSSLAGSTGRTRQYSGADAGTREVSSNAPTKTRKRRDDIDSNVWVTEWSDAQLDKLRVHYKMKGETANHTIVCAEITRRGAVKRAKGTEARTEEARHGTGGTPRTSTGPMKLDEAIAQANAEGFDYDKRVAHDYRDSLNQSPLEPRMVKRLLDGITQTSLANGDFDAAVVFSAHSEGLQQALDAKADHAFAH